MDAVLQAARARRVALHALVSVWNERPSDGGSRHGGSDGGLVVLVRDVDNCVFGAYCEKGAREYT